MSGPAAYSSALRAHSQPLRDEADLNALLQAIGDARIVMLGESTHGTSEFYSWRDRFSRRLIAEHGFSFIAVEGDWPDCQQIHQHITTGTGTAEEAMAGYRRFPTWMWGNHEILALVRWLREWNARGPQRAIGFHGLDVYSLHDSMRLVVEYLERVDPPAAAMARRAYECFEPFGPEPETYARATRYLSESCERAVRSALVQLQRERSRYLGINPDHVDPREAYFDAAMNARVTQHAEAYYRALLSSGSESWNIRDLHMMDTLNQLLEHYGDESRAIVWAHNTHIGDYRATSMRESGYINLGGLAREQLGRQRVFLIGFTTHHGYVTAAQEWGAEGRDMVLPAADHESLDGVLHENAAADQLILLRDVPETQRLILNQVIGHRAVGVVHRPEQERPGNYVPTRLADRYDALVFVDETTAVHPLPIATDQREEPAVYPTGL